MEYFEVPTPPAEGFCSDRACPCPEVKIPRGSGYLYISQQVVDFRRDALTIQEVAEKMARIEREFERKTGVDMAILGSGWATGILVCEQGAKLRGLDLEVAAADAKHWWETGLMPLRATPVVTPSE
jgi:hypothetical protein